MANTNTKISDLISSQAPFFVRNDHQTFVAFMEAYYEYLEQFVETLSEGKVVDRTKHLLEYIDVDQTLDEFLEKYYEEFLSLIPKESVADRTLILKYAKDFYRSKGSEKSLKFLLRILFNKETEFYYPKRDILRASDGKWFIQQSLRVTDVMFNDITTTSFADLELFVNKKIQGSISGSTAIIERVDRFFESGTLINELIITNIDGTFVNGEIVSVINSDIDLNAIIFGGIINTIVVTNVGSNYLVGDFLVFENEGVGSGANAVISSVTSGNIRSLVITNGGAGFRVNNFLSFAGGGGSGANARLTQVDASGNVHPNTYNIFISLILDEANTPIGNAVYSNLNGSNANTTFANSWNSFVYGPTGPASDIIINSRGDGYSSPPEVDIIANTRIRTLGILGRMSIDNAGRDYAANELLRFNSSQGFGANGKITSVNANGSITGVAFTANSGWVIGGFGYHMENLPVVTISTANGVNGSISVTAVLGDGETFLLQSSNIGSIETITIINRGSDYNVAPTINLTGSGDGTAQAVATVISGVFSYPGRYLNDDGHLSSFNFLQDRDYYQNFSYVVKIRESLKSYKKALKDLVHPAGMKLFGEYVLIDEDQSSNATTNIVSEETITYVTGTYVYNNVSGNASITKTSHGFVAGNTAYLEFFNPNIANGEYLVTASANANNFIVYANTFYSNASGNVLIGTLV